MCAACQAEYDDPADRRFHAQPNACPDCGPRIAFHDTKGRPLAEAGAALDAVAGVLLEGRIVAVKGHRRLSPGRGRHQCRRGGRAPTAQGEGRQAVRRHGDRPRDGTVALRCSSRPPNPRSHHSGDRSSSPRRRPGADRRWRRARDGRSRTHAPYTPLHHLLMAKAARPLVMTQRQPLRRPDRTPRRRRLRPPWCRSSTGCWHTTARSTSAATTRS